jgi:hypothetical protein
MIEVDTLRPSGIKRKLMMSPAVAVETAGDYIIGFFPHGAILRGIWFTPSVALGTANSVLDIGLAKDGDTIIDGFAMPYATSAVDTALDCFQTKGTNGGTVEIPAGKTIWAQSDGGSTNGTGYFIIEYEDANN